MSSRSEQLQTVFDQVVALIRSNPDTSEADVITETTTRNQLKLKLYGLYKFINDGPCTDEQAPSIFSIVARAKHNAWKKCDCKSRDQAMMEYIQIVASQANNPSVKQESLRLFLAYRSHQNGDPPRNDEAASTTLDEGENGQPTNTVDMNGETSTETKANQSSSSNTNTHRVDPIQQPSMLSASIFARFMKYFNIQPLIPRGQVDVTLQDLLFAVWQCCTLRFVSSHTTFDELSHKIQTVWHNNNSSTESRQVVAGLSVRSLLDLFLIFKNFPPGSEVIVVPPITVPGMIHVLQHHALDPVAIDIPSISSIVVDVDGILSAITSKTVAIMIVHPFGMISASPDDMRRIRSIADDRNFVVIEDCAECFTGLGDHEHVYRGSPMADICFFSFGIIKTSTAVGGGLAIIKNNTDATEMRRLQRTFYGEQTSNEYFWRVLNCAKARIVASSPSLYGIIAWLWISLGWDFERLVTSNVTGFHKNNTQQQQSVCPPNSDEHGPTMLQIRRRPCLALLAMLIRRLEQAQDGLLPSVASRNSRCRATHKLLHVADPSAIMHDQKGHSNTFWLCPIFCENRNRLSQRVKMMGYDVATGASKLQSVSTLSDRDCRCPLADELMKNVLYLPVASQPFREKDIVSLVTSLVQCSRAPNSITSSKKSTSQPWDRNLTTISSFICAAILLRWIGVRMLLSFAFWVSTSALSLAALLAVIICALRWCMATFYMGSTSTSKSYLSHAYNLLHNAANEDSSTSSTHLDRFFPLSPSVRKSVPSYPNHTKTEQPIIKIVLTGATGFVGSLVLRDMLYYRKRLGVSNIILICRPRRNKSAKERICKMLQEKMFNFISIQEVEELVTVVEGDVSKVDAGLSQADLKDIRSDSNISRVLHCAASVSFKQNLDEAAIANITAPLHMQRLTRSLHDKSAKFVHISTAFVHGGLTGSKDNPLTNELYDLGSHDPAQLYHSMLGNQLYATRAMLELEFPNTYTFSKCICEHLLKQNNSMDTVIIRPSIIGPSIEAPYEGWAGTKPSTIVAASSLYLSYQWNVWCIGDHRVACIPVDVVSRFVLQTVFCDQEIEEPNTTVIAARRKKDDTTPCEPAENGTFTIHNVAWDVSSSEDAIFTWTDYTLAICQIGSTFGHFSLPATYLGLLFANVLLPTIDLSVHSFEKLHTWFVLAPFQFAQIALEALGYKSQRMLVLRSFLDLPLLFFPYMNKSFYFRSRIIAPSTMSGDRYMTSCIVASHNFTQKTTPNATDTSHHLSKRFVTDSTLVPIGGRYHVRNLIDFWWAISQPKGHILFRLAGYCFSKILRSTCSLVTVDANSFGSIPAKVAIMADSDVTVVLAPTHRSFLDFVLLSYILFSMPELGIELPTIIAADDFQQMTVIGWLARWLGALYVKRGGKTPDPTLKTRVKAAKAIKTSTPCFEVFLEGRRSRDRRFVEPKTGFLKCLDETGGQHLIVPIGISYEGIPEQMSMTTEAEGSNRVRPNVPGLLSWIVRVVRGEVKLGRIHVAAHESIVMNCATRDEYAGLGTLIQQRQQEVTYITRYHAEATSRLFNINHNEAKQGLSDLGCTFLKDSTESGIENRLPKCAPSLPTDQSILCTVMFQYAHVLAPSLKESRWSSWLFRSIDKGHIASSSVSSRGIDSPQADSIVQALVALLDRADSAAEQAKSILMENSKFVAPSLEHTIAIAARQDAAIPRILIKAAATMSFQKAATRQQDARVDRAYFQRKDHIVCDGEENLGFWGFQDSGFTIQSDKRGQPYVTMKGNRYGLCQTRIRKLFPFIEDEMRVKINPETQTERALQEMRTEVASRLDESDLALLGGVVPNISTNSFERARQSSGHSQEDVFRLRFGAWGRIPDAVVWPTSEEQVIELIDIAKKMSWCIIPVGGGTNVTNATRCPTLDEEPRKIISVNTKQLNKVIWLNEQDGLAHVEAGITGKELSQEMAKRGFTVGHEPDSYEFSTLGGWIATKASGMKRSKYGNIEDMVKSVRVVNTIGTIETGNLHGNTVAGRVSEGIDMASLILGSEGCFGIITSAVVRVWPIAEAKEFDSVLLPTFQCGLGLMKDVSKLGGRSPSSVRLLDNAHFRLGQSLRPETESGLERAVESLVKLSLSFHRHLDKASVVCATIAYEGTVDEVAEQKWTMANLASKHGGLRLGSRVGKTGYDLTFMIAYLRDFALSYDLLGESFETFVPWSKIEMVIQKTKDRIEHEHNCRYLPGKPFVGSRITQLYHEGVCIYFYFCMSTEGVSGPSEIFTEIEHAAREEIMKHGGSLSHHHGIGKIRSSFLRDRSSPATLEVMKRLKSLMDEDNIFAANNGILGGGSDR